MDNDKNPENEVEYVDAVPIERDESLIAKPRNDHETWHNQTNPFENPHVRVVQTSGCTPCCGPLGCIAVILLITGLLMQSELFRDILVGLFLFMAVMSMMSFFSQRR